MISKSGLGKAIKHQMKALSENKIEYTTDPNDNYDIVHINFYGPTSYLLAKKAKKNGKRLYTTLTLQKKILKIPLYFQIK